MTDLPDATGVIADQERQDKLEEWYELDGRKDKSHPQHSLYTGLAQKYGNKSSENAKSLNIEKLFNRYWAESFPTAPANKQSAASHIAFAQYVLIQVESIQSEEDGQAVSG